MRRPLRGGGDAWSDGWTRAEKLSVDTTFSDAPVDKTGGQISYEGRWPADEEVGIARYFLFPQHPNVQPSRSIEIYACPILGIGRAIAYVAVSVRQGFEEGSGFLCKGMLTAAAGSV
jgi:hypothetical protein